MEFKEKQVRAGIEELMSGEHLLAQCAEEAEAIRRSLRSSDFLPEELTRELHKESAAIWCGCVR